jgi:arylsulfatase A-like enzyme
MFFAQGCSSAPERWNVLIACLDTVRFDTFWLPERAGLSDDFSPWAERALRFDRTLAPAPWTVPSVASLLSGRYPASHGAGFGDDEIAELGKRPPAPLPRTVPTLMELLGARGYRTGGFVANPFFSLTGLDRGGLEVDSDASAQRIVRLAESWLDRGAAGERPFFLYLHFMDANVRRFTQSLDEMAAKIELLPAELRTEAMATAPAGICRSIEQRFCRAYLTYVHDALELRRQMARVLEGLRRRGLLEHTIVVLYSDHGEEFLDHVEPQRERGTDPRGAKGLYGLGHGHAMYQELLHVPLLVWHPARRGADVEVGTSLVDVVPTILDWLGIHPRQTSWDGVSLAEIDGLGERARFASGMALGPPESVVLRGRWKLIRRRMPDERVLFDLGTDPLERSPVDDPALTRELEVLLSRRSGIAPPAAEPRPEIPSDTLRALQALGYLEDATPE